jgi:catechol 2,3-dioxygenase-like lactoylglutathione lyase family enzyme
MQLGMLMIFVSDLVEAKRFYCDVLGFGVKAENETRLEFVHEPCAFVAFKCEKDATVEEYSQVARSVFVFEVPSIDEAFSALKNKGVTFLHDEPAENDLGRYAAFRDPFGNVHEIYERKTARSCQGLSAQPPQVDKGPPPNGS